MKVILAMLTAASMLASAQQATAEGIPPIDAALFDFHFDWNVSLCITS
mgnify:CR=1 FL=1